jgi:hypothetical protein
MKILLEIFAAPPPREPVAAGTAASDRKEA